MGPVIIVALIVLVLFAAFGIGLYLFVKKTDPRKKDSSEKSDIKQAQEFLPFEDITNNMIILAGHRYRAVLTCSSTNYQLKTVGEREQIEMSFQRFLNSITFPLTFFMQTKVIDNTTRLMDLEKDCDQAVREFPNMQGYAEQYQKDMANLSAAIGNNQQKKRYIIVTYDDSGALDTLSDEEKVIHAEKELLHRCNTVISNLQAVGVKATIMGTADLIELVYSCYYRDDYSYAEAIADKEPFALFVEGREDKFMEMPKMQMLDLILGETINKVTLSNIDSDISGKKVLEELQQLRSKYAGYYKELGGESSV